MTIVGPRTLKPSNGSGVEFGKVLAGALIPALRDGAAIGADASTTGLIARVQELG